MACNSPRVTEQSNGHDFWATTSNKQLNFVQHVQIPT